MTPSVIPASGKHAARPKWKVINTALTLAAVFLIGTGIVQLFAANQWKIPATEGYSTLLIEYEIMSVQTLGKGVEPGDIDVTDADLEAAEIVYEKRLAEHAFEGPVGTEETPTEELYSNLPKDDAIELIAQDIALSSAITSSVTGTPGETFLFVAGT